MLAETLCVHVSTRSEQGREQHLDYGLCRQPCPHNIVALRPTHYLPDRLFQQMCVFMVFLSALQDLQWEDRERVLRLLFAKINHQAKQSFYANLPAHSFKDFPGNDALHGTATKAGPARLA